MDDKVSRLQLVALRAGMMMYCAAGMTFGLAVQHLISLLERHSGAVLVFAMVGQSLLTVGLPSLLVVSGYQLRRIARQVA